MKNQALAFFIPIAVGMLVILQACSPPAELKRQSAICMTDGFEIKKVPVASDTTSLRVSFGDTLEVYPDSILLIIRDTSRIFKKVRMASDTLSGGWIRGDRLALNCRRGAVVGSHSEIYAEDLTPLDTIPRMTFVAMRQSSIPGYMKVYARISPGRPLLTGLMPVGKLTVDPVATNFAIRYSSAVVDPNPVSALESLFRHSILDTRKTEFFKTVFRNRLDSAMLHGINYRKSASRMALLLMRDTTIVYVSSYIMDPEGNLTDSLVKEYYANKLISFRTWATGKGKVAIHLTSTAKDFHPTRQDSVMINGIAVHFVDAMNCHENVTIAVDRNGIPVFKRIVRLDAGE